LIQGLGSHEFIVIIFITMFSLVTMLFTVALLLLIQNVYIVSSRVFLYYS